MPDLNIVLPASRVFNAIKIYREISKFRLELMDFYVRKSSGELERFDIEKFKRSLDRPEADIEKIDSIVSYILSNVKFFKTTEDIYKYALDSLSDSLHMLLQDII